MSTLERAIQIAAIGHAGQVDKGGSPYIFHPLRIMLKGHDERHQIVGVLHDLLEDTSWTAEDLAKEGFDQSILRALDYLTRRPGETYDSYVERARCR
jgi:(p)ppGpp synthase/HD superfamily hydrolase